MESVPEQEGAGRVPFVSKLRIAIVGFGLMGGSLGLALRPFAAELVAVDANPDSLQAALAAGAVDRTSTNLAGGVAGVDLIVLAAPVRAILQVLEQLPQIRPDGCLIMDLGSTKQEICERMAALPAVFQSIGGHPMCGKESPGFAQADRSLYHDRIFVLCRHQRTTPLIEQIALEVVSLVGGRPLFLPPALHDQLVSLTSHLPYLAAALLMRQAATAAADEPHLWPVSASGFRDSSRLAGSSPQVMGDILHTNRAAVLGQLRLYQQSLAELVALLETGSETEVANWLAAARQAYQTYKESTS
jgi:prephenate dehydrogenase